jgi:hypothetical protein
LKPHHDEFLVMQWFRANLKVSARLAIFALTVQIALAFGHVHLVNFAHYPIASSTQSDPSAPTQPPAGFHRIRYYGLLASGQRAENIARARKLLTPPMIPIDAINAISASEQTAEPQTERRPCPCCGGPMIIIERFQRGCQPKHQPSPFPAAIRIDTS